MNELEKITKKLNEGEIDLGKMNPKLSEMIKDELEKAQCIGGYYPHSDSNHHDYNQYQAYSDHCEHHDYGDSTKQA
jgi:hypothetical protein